MFPQCKNVVPSLAGPLLRKEEKSKMRKLILCFLLLGAVSVAKTKPEEFTLTAKVTAVIKHDNIVGLRADNDHQSAYTEYNRPEYTAEREIFYVIVAEIGGKIYELKGETPLVEGTYQAKRKSRAFQFLYTDKHGKVVPTRPLRIIGERMKK